ncbi:MAG TPA: hypothetical protein VKU82_11605 [Planctomycetaceae bacterium]|nr:hypothetical protein [Planctomycetaceae bacterium]
MKSEHRHDLQTNELGKIADKLANFIEVHGNRLMIGICVVALLASAGIFWWRSKTAAETAAWRDLSAALATNNTANRPDDFYDVWEAHKGSLPGLWARVHEGESRLREGVQTMFRDTEKGVDVLKKAQAAFQTITDDRRAPAELRERALIGLGRALESMSDGSEDDAVQAYQTLVDEYPNSVYKADAQARIAALTKPGGQEFYAWFSKFPRPKGPEKRPRDSGVSEPDDEDLSLPGALDSLLHSGPKKTADDDSSPGTSDGAAQPADEPDDANADDDARPAPPATPTDDESDDRSSN